MSTNKINKEAFYRRTKKLYKQWRDDSNPMNSADALICAMGVDEDVSYSKTTALQTWLIGYELTDTLIVFCENFVYFLASKKKIEVLKQIESNFDRSVPPVKLFMRDKADNDKKNFEKIVAAIKESKKGCTLGVFIKDKFGSTFMDAWRSHIKSFEVVDIGNPMALLMSVKDVDEVITIKKACQVSMDIYSKYLREQIMDIVDNDKRCKHSKLSEGVEEAISDKKYAQNLEISQLDLCYPAIIQSGGNYKLKFSVVSDKEFLKFGAIVCCLGARYKQYCSNIVRTILVDPSEDIQSTYNFLLEIEEHISGLLSSDAKASVVYDKTILFVKKNRPELIDKLTKCFGFAMGIEFRESSITIGANCHVLLESGMVFNINIGISGLHDEANKNAKDVALFVGDTYLVNVKGSPATLLTPSKKKLKHVAIFLKNEEDDDDDGEVKEIINGDVALVARRGKRTTVIESKLRQDSTADEKRKEKQRALLTKMNEEALARIMSGSDKKDSVKAKKAPVSYRGPGQLPREPEVKALKIYVDKKYETIIMPVFGIPVPFHVATVKNISQSIEGKYTYLRINFFHPGASMVRDSSFTFANPEATFLKELTYRSTNVKEPGEISAPSSNINTAFRLIKELQKAYKTREADEKEKADLVEQDSIIISTQGKGNPRLKDLYIRPNIVQKRLSGILEAHTNGFRYTSIRGDKVDILYSNVKHAFFQPCDGEMIILLHFHLHNAILFGKKKQLDVQFYTEVGEITTDLGKSQHMHDRDDLAAEQAERELRHKLKVAFKSFCEKCEAVSKGELEFETPFRELGFYGVPFRETVLLQPTSGCLTNLTQWPPLVITLETIQLVHFERVSFMLKNFDMVFIFKDYSKKVASITTIPMNMLDHVKEWLNSVDIKYTEGVQSLNWVKIMKTIVDDPEGFFETGGWNFLDTQSDSDDEEDEDSEDEEYRVTDEDGEEEDDDESEDDYSSDESEEYDEDELGSDESEGKDWSDLEREAVEDDMEDENDDSRGGHRHKKHKHNSPEKRSSKHNGTSKHHSDKHHSDKRRRDTSNGDDRKSSKKSRHR